MQCHYAFIIWVYVRCGIASSGIIDEENWNISFDLGYEFIIGLRKNKNCLGKLCFKGQIQADSFLLELIFNLLSHIIQGDSWINCEQDNMLLF